MVLVDFLSSLAHYYCKFCCLSSFSFQCQLFTRLPLHIPGFQCHLYFTVDKQSDFREAGPFFFWCFFAQWELFGHNDGSKMGIKRHKDIETFAPSGSFSFSIMCLPSSSIKVVYESCQISCQCGWSEVSLFNALWAQYLIWLFRVNAKIPTCEQTGWMRHW